MLDFSFYYYFKLNKCFCGSCRCKIPYGQPITVLLSGTDDTSIPLFYYIFIRMPLGFLPTFRVFVTVWDDTLTTETVLLS